LATEQQYITDRELPDRVALCLDFRVTASETRPAAQAPKPAFTTSTMLQAGSVSLGFTPEETAALAQKLFEQGLVTYHRTDSQNFSAEAIVDIRAYAKANNLPLPEEPRRWKSKDNAQDAHEAIRPTHLEHQQGGEDERQQKLYDMIWKRAVASQLADAEYSVTTLQLTAASGPDSFAFKATGRVLTKQGWRVLTPRDAAEDTSDSEETDATAGGAVPSLPIDSTVTASSTRVTDKVTKAPNAYTQASLIKKLETEGIGRPSTYPETLKKIITTRKYVDERKRKLAPSELGKLLVTSLVGHFSFADYSYTRDLEQHLDDIAAGKASLSPGTYEVRMPDGGEVRRFTVKAGGAIDFSSAQAMVRVAIRFDGNAGRRPQVTLTDTTDGSRFTSDGDRGGFGEPSGFGRHRDEAGAAVNVPPGSYRVSVSTGEDSYLSGMTAAGAQASGQIVQVTGGSPVLTLKMAAGRAHVTGVARRGDAASAGAMVLLVPASAELGGAGGGVLQAETNTDGSFSLGTVVPGPYILVVLEGGWAVNWRDPGTLAGYLEHGLPLDLKPAVTQKVQVDALVP
jgi:hypothetical protein